MGIVMYELFLFDADDTLFDFGASERYALYKALEQLGVSENLDSIYKTYRQESTRLWRQLELGKTTKEFLKKERFRRTLEFHQLPDCSEELSELYLRLLSEKVFLVDSAQEICCYLKDFAEVGIITNGIDHVQKARLERSGLKPYIDFMVVSEECGFAKPDRRFFEYAIQKAERYNPETTLVIGDRLETDIQGANDFSLHSCWYNPNSLKNTLSVQPTHEICHLTELKNILER